METKDDKIIYKDIDKDDPEISDIRNKLIPASAIKDCLENEDYETLKQYIPKEIYEIFINEFKEYKSKQNTTSHNLTNNDRRIKILNIKLRNKRLTEEKRKELINELEQLTGVKYQQQNNTPNSYIEKLNKFIKLIETKSITQKQMDILYNTIDVLDSFMQ